MISVRKANNFCRSTDGGLTFGPPQFVRPALAWGTLAVGPDGALYYAGTDGSRVYVLKSTNAQDPAAAGGVRVTVAEVFGGHMTAGAAP